MTPTSLKFHLARWASCSLPAPAALRLAERLADVQHRCSVKDRSAVQANLSLVLGASAARHPLMVRDVFRNFGRYLVEFFTMHHASRAACRVDGEAHLRQAHAQRRGAIILTAHLGNWELGAAAIRRMGFPISAVALPHRDADTNRLFNSQRQRCGVMTIPLGPSASRQCLAVLHAGGLLGLLGDWELTGHSIAANLFDRAVNLPRGPALLSLRSGAPILPTFLVREADWRFRLCIEPPLWPARQVSVTASLQTLVQTYAAMLERYVRQWPSQWMLFRPLAA